MTARSPDARPGVGPAGPPGAHDARLDRRAVLARAAAIAAALGLPRSAWAELVGRSALPRGGPPLPPVPPVPPVGKALSREEARTLAAVQETLWPPGDGVPGAAALRATEVLDAALADPDTPPVVATWVRAGLPRLHEAAAARGASRFEALDASAQEAVLVAVRETADGAGWIRLVLRYTLEAVLGDPVHGGNVGEAGWAWAGFEPGAPRPSAPGR